MGHVTPPRLLRPRCAFVASRPNRPLPADVFTVRGTHAETRFAALAGTGHLTPAGHFFVRNHTRTPRIDAATWQLTVHGDGLTGGPLRLTLDELRALPAVTRTAFLECAGTAAATSPPNRASRSAAPPGPSA